VTKRLGGGIGIGEASLNKLHAAIVQASAASPNSDLGPRLSLVRSSLNNGHAGAAASCPFGANKGHESRDLDIEIQGFEGTLCTGAE
jgi:hypothetical protein